MIVEGLPPPCKITLDSRYRAPRSGRFRRHNVEVSVEVSPRFAFCTLEPCAITGGLALELPVLTHITSAAHAHQYLRPRFRQDVEEVWVIALNADRRILAADCVFRGSVDVCLFHPRDIFRFGCLQNAASLLIAHNHPSGSPLPSPQDILVTKQLCFAASLLQLPLVDHLILAGSIYYSFAESNALPNPSWKRHCK